MPQQPSINRVERVCDRDDKSLYFIIRSSDRRKASQFLQPGDVPAYEGTVAYFEMVKVPAKPWPRWEVLRQVEKPAWMK